MVESRAHQNPSSWLARHEATTLCELFEARVARTPEKRAYRFYSPQDHDWRDFSWQEAAARVACWRRVLHARGIGPGDRVAIMLRNSPEWMCVAQATMSLGGVTVGLLCGDTPACNAHLLHDSGAGLLVAVKARWVHRLLAEQARDDALQEALVFTGELSGESRLTSAFEALRVARSCPEPATVPPGPDDLASLIYTSGTHGRARGAMMTHANLLSNAHGMAQALPVIADEYAVSCLPLAHGYERVANVYRAMITGTPIVFCRYPRFLKITLAREPITTLVAVPRTYERFYAELRRWMARRPKLVQWAIEFTISVGESIFEKEQGRGGFRLSHILWPLLRRVVARRCLRLFGGQMQLLVSGAAALPYPVARTLIGLGLPVLQGYGLTEAGPVVSINRRHDNEPQSVGLAIDGVELRISADNELIIRSPGVMKGYWNQPQASAQVLAPGGWLHSGDKVSRLDTSHLYLTGRMKEVIVLSSGDKVSPEPIEMALRQDPLIDHAVVVGEARPVLVAIVSAPAHRLVPVMRRLGLDPEQSESLQHLRLENYFIDRLQRLTQSFPRHAQIRRVVVSTQTWNQSKALLTANGKVRRRQVARYYAWQVRRLYGRRATAEKTDVSQNTNQG